MLVGIVGSGLFGMIIARRLVDLGHIVYVYSNELPEAGSSPAACLMKPSWFAGMGRDIYEPSLKLLESQYGLMSVLFKANLIKTEVAWIPPRQILYDSKVQRINSTVTAVTDKGHIIIDNREHGFDVIIVAAGVWTNEILPKEYHVPRLAAKAGCAYLFPGQIEEPFISVWAPYKQIVAFNIDFENIWVGDGTALIPASMTRERRAKSRLRCAKAIGRDPNEATEICGYRPYVAKASPCYLEEVSQHLWVVTGGAKNGTIAAGWCAHVIGERLNAYGTEDTASEEGRT